MNLWARSSLQDQKTVAKVDRFQSFLGLALVFFLIHFFVGYRSSRLIPKPLAPKLRFSPKTTAAALVLFATLLVPNLSWAQSLNAYLNNKKGIQKFEKGDFDGAAQDFDRAHNLDREDAKLDFNTGTALAKGSRKEDSFTHFQSATKKALEQADYATAIQSLYNEGLVQKDAKNFDAAYDRLTKAIELSKSIQDPELERKAREALSVAAQQEQKEQQQKDDKKDGGEGQDESKKPSEGDGKGSDQGDDEKERESENKKPSNSNKRPFKSGTLSKDVAEGIMNDLSDREKQLYNRRLKDQRGKEAPHDKDW
jgi:tetratricopeptide (TPR) repeat protein